MPALLACRNLAQVELRRAMLDVEEPLPTDYWMAILFNNLPELENLKLARPGLGELLLR